MPSPTLFSELANQLPKMTSFKQSNFVFCNHPTITTDVQPIVLLIELPILILFSRIVVHQSCYQNLMKIRLSCTELDSAASSFCLSSAALSFSNKVIPQPQLDKTLGRIGQTLRACKTHGLIGQTLRACTVAENL